MGALPHGSQVPAENDGDDQLADLFVMAWTMRLLDHIIADDSSPDELERLALQAHADLSRTQIDQLAMALREGVDRMRIDGMNPLRTGKPSYSSGENG